MISETSLGMMRSLPLVGGRRPRRSQRSRDRGLL